MIRFEEEFHKCAKEHLNSPDIEYRLYREGLSWRKHSSISFRILFVLFIKRPKLAGLVNGNIFMNSIYV